MGYMDSDPGGLEVHRAGAVDGTIVRCFAGNGMLYNHSTDSWTARAPMPVPASMTAQWR
jgi:hypothetical protein